MDAESGDGGDVDDGQVFGQFLAEHVHQFLVQQVAFCHGEHAVFVQHAGVELFEFSEQDFIFLGDVLRVAGHHEEQE